MANTGSERTSVLYSRDRVLTLQMSKKNVQGLGGESCYSLRMPPAPSTSLSGQPQPFLFSSQGVQALRHPRKPSCWQALAPPTWLALCFTSHAAHPIKLCTRHLFLRFPVIYPSPHPSYVRVGTGLTPQHPHFSPVSEIRLHILEVTVRIKCKKESMPGRMPYTQLMFNNSPR